jgi:hypothetical protein
MRRVEWWMYQQRGSAGRWGEERQRRAESPSGGRALGHGGWRLGSTQMARGGPPERRGERAWPGRARRQARVGRHRGSGVAAAVVDEREIGKASRGRRGRAWRRQGRQNRARRGRGRRGRARRRQGRRGRGNGQTVGSWPHGVQATTQVVAPGVGGTGSDSRRESRSVGEVEPTRGNTSSSKT